MYETEFNLQDSNRKIYSCYFQLIVTFQNLYFSKVKIRKKFVLAAEIIEEVL